MKSLNEARDAIDWYAAARLPADQDLQLLPQPEWVAETDEVRASTWVARERTHPGFMRAEQAVRAGYDEIQHINQVMLNFFLGPKDDTRTLARFYLVADNAHSSTSTSKPVLDFIALLKERGTTIDPTLATFEAMFTQRQGEPSLLRRGCLACTGIAPACLAHQLNGCDRGKCRPLSCVVRKAPGLHQANARCRHPLVAGTDDIAGFTLHRELELYVKAGIPAGEALRIATWNGASVTGTLPSLGSIAAHKSADVILVDGDPTKDISAIRKISLVMKEGEVFYPAEIYEALGVKRFVEPPRVEQPDARRQIPTPASGASTRHAH